MKLNVLFFLSVLLSIATFGQQRQLSNQAEISVLTIGPGDNLNDAFGHNGFRIKDKQLGLDVVYGYGEYDFDTPNFYLKFAQGKLNYLISKHSFSNFYKIYKYYDRTIDEQVLNLSSSEKQHLYDYLVNNYKPENRRYLYDFFYDNCATRIRDVTKRVTDKNIVFSTSPDYKAKTFRQLIHEHVGLNTWGSFGIDIALGSVIDRKAEPYEQMFLPKYIHDFFGQTKINNSENLVKKNTTIYKRKNQNTANEFLWSPLLIMSVISVLILFVTYKDRKHKRLSRWLDVVLFGLTGIIGILLLFLWFGTNHSATAQNYNMLWAFPLNLLMIRQLLKTQVKNWFKKYLKFLIIMFCLMTLHWIIGVQVFAIALIPLMTALFIRYIYMLKYFNRV
ncbi:lipoprotein N-acyltransferase Lnb domain-containing protein [Psychroserpens ponticola]|uniref:DUF4105 domain-containing protein n=1 Tax=Psychroserpens ponticola TaxID=2932268 RepID=A0ABY7S269_9FLAO|nr:DUF4105 domain-containing protein [Psychroserpens ponticola]WCO02551.1 DUF4105 domain-containing protein [Psychroserpens ponticola]